MTEKKSVFETLSKIDVSNHIQVIRMKKGPALKYVSWAWAWNMVKSKYPDATRKIEEYPEYQYDQKEGKWYATGQMLDYRITPAGCEVKVTVTIQGKEYSERLYVMDMRNQPVTNPNISQINKTQQRCLVKALAMAGLGLNLYAGEDLPMGDISERDEEQSKKKQKATVLNARKEAYSQVVREIAKVNGDSVAETNKGIAETLKADPNYNKLTEDEKVIKSINVANKMLESAKKMKEEQETG